MPYNYLPFVHHRLFSGLCLGLLLSLYGNADDQSVTPSKFDGNLGTLVLLDVSSSLEESSSLGSNEFPGANEDVDSSLLAASVVPDAEESENNSKVKKSHAPAKPEPENKEPNDVSADSQASSGDVLPFLTTDFFAGSINLESSMDDDSMGVQRLIQVKNSKISSFVSGNSSFKYTSNPEKAKDPVSRKDGTTLDLSYSYTLNLGEYAAWDSVFAPSLNFMQARTLNDLPGDYGNDLNVYDGDLYIAGVSLPFILPDDYNLIIGHSYTETYNFRGIYEKTSSQNKPSVTLAKNFSLANGDSLSLSASLDYTFARNASSYKDSIINSAGQDFYLLWEKIVGGADIVSSRFPLNLQSGSSHAFSLIYSRPLDDRTVLMPSFAYQYYNFSQGDNTKRSDRTYNLGVSVIRSVFDWLNVTGLASYTRKESSFADGPKYDDFQIGFGCNAFYSF